MSDGTYMYLVVNKQLGMSTGKIAAQCGHAVQQLMTHYYEQIQEPACGKSQPCLERLITFQHWLKDPAKVVLEADADTWKKITSLNAYTVLIVDEGRTEVAPNSETVIGFWPMYKSKQLSELRVLPTLKDAQCAT